MAPRAYRKGYLELSLCPIAVFPAASQPEEFSFHQINEYTGHRIKSLSRHGRAPAWRAARRRKAS
jgi:non-homologous end joining protein Ku